MYVCARSVHRLEARTFVTNMRTHSAISYTHTHTQRLVLPRVSLSSLFLLLPFSFYRSFPSFGTIVQHFSISPCPLSARRSLIPPSLLAPLLLPHLAAASTPSLTYRIHTFVCLNWVAFYTRAWSVNRILNYYSDCVSLGEVSRYLAECWSTLSPFSP